jgi:hypothetical protein
LHSTSVPASNASTNWSGYIDNGAGAQFTDVSATWTVPTAHAGATGFSSTWVGIDGTASSDLIQAGTEQDWSSSGPVYYAWYELLPKASMVLGTVSPGDKISVTINQTASTTWDIRVDDLTQRSVWGGPVTYSAPGTSAEWIEEAPTDGSSGNVEPLADFGTAVFSDLDVGGTEMQAALAMPVYMVSRATSAIEAYPDEYNATTNSFSITYGSPGPAPTSFPDVPIDSTTTTAPTTATTGATTTTLPGTTAPVVPRGSHGYWLTGTDGGIFAFGTARFFGSTGNLHLQRPIVGMAPTSDHGGYLLVASDGGVFAFGDATYFGSVPALGVAPAGSRKARHLEAPIVGIEPSADGKGYLMVASDGGVFAFGDAHFAGSCASIHGCSAPVVAVVPDKTGYGYWLLLRNCQMIAFGNAPKVASADCQAYATTQHVNAVSAARTPDGDGYWSLLADGTVYPEGDATALGTWKASRASGWAADHAVAITATSDGGGAWVALAKGSVTNYGDAPALGGMSGTRLSAPVVAAAGW